MSKNRRHVKKEAIAKVSLGNPRFAEFADHVVNPSHSRSMLAPSLCPSRAGAVTFPMIVDVTGVSDFAVIVQPSLVNPLMISHTSAIPESGAFMSGSYYKETGEVTCILTAVENCSSESIHFEGKPCITMSSAAGATIAVNISISGSHGGPASYTGSALYYSAGAWVTGGSVAVTPGFGVAGIPAFVYPSTATHFTLELDAGSVGANTIPLDGNYTLTPTVGTLSCAAAYSESVFDVFYPEWDKVIEVADKISIPFMDCLITYQGSTLSNQGAIAVAGCSEEIVPSDGFYSAIATRPFDSYEGRLASQGETDGGAHWHLLHDDIRAYSLTNPADLVVGPRGYFGVKNMDPTQTVRVKVQLVLNYYTIDPAFSMAFQPPWGQTDLLLYTLRTQVPLVSSNDSHLDKLLRLAKRKAKEAAMWAIQNPEEAAMMAMKGAGTVAMML